MFHVTAGVLVVAALIAHTGFRPGHNLNLLLMLGFTGLLLVLIHGSFQRKKSGALVGVDCANPHR